MGRYREVLRAILVNDRRLLDDLMATTSTGPPTQEAMAALDPKTGALVRVAASISIDAPVDTLRWTIGDALDAGAVPDEVVDVLLLIAPLVGLARVSATAPKVALALDYDLERALEAFDR